MAENAVQAGDRVTYHGRHENVCSGIVAERVPSVLMPGSMMDRLRVVDFASEIADPDAGRWLTVDDLIGAWPPA